MVQASWAAFGSYNITLRPPRWFRSSGSTGTCHSACSSIPVVSLTSSLAFLLNVTSASDALLSTCSISPSIVLYALMDYPSLRMYQISLEYSLRTRVTLEYVCCGQGLSLGHCGVPRFTAVSERKCSVNIANRS